MGDTYCDVTYAYANCLQSMIDGTFSVHGVLLPRLVGYFDVGRGQIAAIGSAIGGCLLLSGETDVDRTYFSSTSTVWVGSF